MTRASNWPVVLVLVALLAFAVRTAWAAPAEAAPQPQQSYARRLLGTTARPYSSTDMATGLSMMSAQSNIRAAVNVGTPSAVFQATEGAAIGSRAASYGYYGYNELWPRK